MIHHGNPIDIRDSQVTAPQPVIAGEVNECPIYGTHTEIYSPLVGYLHPVEQWIDGKHAEFSDRKTYSTEPVVHA